MVVSPVSIHVLCQRSSNPTGPAASAAVYVTRLEEKKRDPRELPEEVVRTGKQVVELSSFLYQVAIARWSWNSVHSLTGLRYQEPLLQVLPLRRQVPPQATPSELRDPLSFGHQRKSRPLREQHIMPRTTSP